MKKLSTLLLILAISLWAGNVFAIAQSPVYLTSMKPSDKLGFSVASDFSNAKIPLGGVLYNNGFALQILQGPMRRGFVEYSLKGKYSHIMFILGTSPYHQVNRDKGVFAVYGDGNILLDKVISPNSAPERITLDISGVDVLRFEIVDGDVTVGVVEATLWTGSQSPREIGRVTNASKKVTTLVKDLKPYFVSSAHQEIGPDEGVKSVRLSGVEYDNGLLMSANMQLIGEGTAWTEFNLGGLYKQLKLTFGPVNSTGGSLGRAWLTIRSNGKVIAEYEIEEQQLSKDVVLDVSGCSQLTIESEQASGSSSIAVVNMTAYPEGMELVADEREMGKEAITDDLDLSHLPDVCKLISNIPPYALAGVNDASKNLYNGKSQHVTFSMGGEKFWEGVILQSSTNILNDNTMAHAIFNLGGEFDYLSFTVGWVGKCGVLKNDRLKIYADQEVVLDMPLMATAPNQHIIVPLHRCHKLTIEKCGMVSMQHPAYGVADMVVYRGEPVKNDLFVHPKPETPDEIDLIDLGAPYIHYVNGLPFGMSEFHDGSLKKEYFTLPDGERVNKGFVLSTSVHFDLEMGPLGGEGSGTGIVAGAIGSSILVGAVGGATVTLVSPFGAFLALAAGGTALESSCAAFNTYGEYDQVSFTVANMQNQKNGFEPKTTLLIGGDHEILHEIELDINAAPTTFTLPINKCHQLMFWLKCGDTSSVPYLFYDVRVTKGAVFTEVSSGDGYAGLKATVEPYELPVIGFERRSIEWEEPKYCNVKYIDDYFHDCAELKKRIDGFIGASKLSRPVFVENLLYDVNMNRLEDVGYYSPLTTSAVCVTDHNGVNFRKVQISADGRPLTFPEALAYINSVIGIAQNLKQEISLMKISQANANISLPELGLGAFSVGKLIKSAAQMLSSYSDALDALIDEKNKEVSIINRLLDDGVYQGDFISGDNVVYVR